MDSPHKRPVARKMLPFHGVIIELLILFARNIPLHTYTGLSTIHMTAMTYTRQRCRGACQFPERSDNYKYKSRGFETLRDLTITRLIGY